MSAEQSYTVREAAWAKDGAALLEVRTAVFVVEQGVAVEIERDGLDPECWHALATDSEARAIGAGRLMRTGKIGRMAVLESWRGRGVGASLMRCLLARADAEGLAQTYLHSQSRAAGFYTQFGFAAEGDEFGEAGIPHLRMVRLR